MARAAAAKPNGHDPPPPVPHANAQDRPHAASGRGQRQLHERGGRFDEARARAAEQRLLEAIRERPGLGPGPLARALAAPLSSTKQRLERLADAGTIERGSDGGWRVAGEEARPMAASPN
jgi:hypothetical protein